MKFTKKYTKSGGPSRQPTSPESMTNSSHTEQMIDRMSLKTLPTVVLFLLVVLPGDWAGSAAETGDW